MKCKECGGKMYLLNEILIIDGIYHFLSECCCGVIYDENGNDVTEYYYKINLINGNSSI